MMGYRLLAGLAIPFLFYFSLTPYTYPLIGFLIVLAASPARRKVALVAASLVLGFFSPHIFTYNVYPATDFYESRLLSPPLLSGAVAMLSAFLIFLMARKWSTYSAPAKERLRLLLPLGAVGLFGFVRMVPWPSEIYPFALIFALSFGFYVWFIALSLERTTPGNVYSSNKKFWIFSAFFMRDSIPYFHLNSLAAVETKVEERPAVRYDQLFWKIVELSAISAVIWAGDQVVFGYFALPNPWYIGTAEFIHQSPNLLSAWLVVVFLTVRFIVFVHVRCSIAALTLFLFGVAPVFNLNKPWKAKSLHEFVGRSIYFYNHTLTTVYWPSALRILRGLKLPDRMKLSFLVFFSAFYFSYFYHLIRGHQMLLQKGFTEGLSNYTFAISPFVFSFSLAMGLSVAIKEVWQWGNRWAAVRISKIFVFILIYSLILSLDFNFQFEPLSVKLELIRFLLTGSR